MYMYSMVFTCTVWYVHLQYGMQGWQAAFTAGIIRRLKPDKTGPDKTGPDNTPKSGFYRLLLAFSIFLIFPPLKLSYHFICLLYR